MGRHCAQLHLGHDRQSEGRRLSPPRRLSQRARQPDGAGDPAAPCLSLDPADVSLQRLVLSLDDHGAGRHACLPAPGRGRTHLPGDRRRRGDSFLRRAGRSQHAGQRAGGRKAPASAPGGSDDRRRAAARGGHRGDGNGGFPDYPRLRPDRDLRAGRGMRLARGLGRPGVGGTGRPQGAAGGRLPGPGGHHGGRRGYPPAGAPGRRDDRRGLPPRQHRHEGLSQEPAGDGRGVRRRMVSFGRPRRVARGRLCRAQGPLEGHHHLGGRKHIEHRGGGSPLSPPRRAGSRGHRAPRREMGGDALRLRHPEGGRRARPRRTSSPFAAAISPISRLRRRWCSATCPRPPPARSRNSCCGNGPARSAKPEGRS